MSTNSTDVAVRRLGEDELRAIRSFDDARALAHAVDGDVVDIADSPLSTGFAVLATDAKARLVGVPFIILDWRFANGDNGEFVSLVVVTKSNEKLIVNDGSTGIRDQMKRLGATPRAIGVRHGLRVSEYDYEDMDKSTGEITIKRAKTYYLDTSA